MTEERRLTAIMFTDVCSFSKIMGEDERRALSIVEAVDTCVDAGTKVYGGRIIKKLGDGLLVEFSSAVNAVKCALEVQRAVADYNSHCAPEETFDIRIGIHVGDVVVSGDDIMGDGVNVASRIQPLAEPGGICISRDVFHLINNKLGIETVYLGPHDLKNIARQVDIYKVLIDAVSQPGKTIVRNEGQAARRKRRWIYTAAGAAAVLALLLVLPALHRAGQRAKARKAFESISARATELNQAGNPAEALKTLNAYPAAFSNSEWQAQINALKAKTQHRLDRKTVEEKQLAFLRAIENDDKPTAMGMIEPAIAARLEETGFWGKLRMLAGLLKLARKGVDTFKIHEVLFSEDGTSAVVAMKVRRKPAEGTGPDGEWDKIPPFKWKKIGGDWVMTPEVPAAGAGPQGQPRPRRPFPERKDELKSDRRPVPDR